MPISIFLEGRRNLSTLPCMPCVDQDFIGSHVPMIWPSQLPGWRAPAMVAPPVPIVFTRRCGTTQIIRLAGPRAPLARSVSVLSLARPSHAPHPHPSYVLSVQPLHQRNITGENDGRPVARSSGKRGRLLSSDPPERIPRLSGLPRSTTRNRPQAESCPAMHICLRFALPPRHKLCPPLQSSFIAATSAVDAILLHPCLALSSSTRWSILDRWETASRSLPDVAHRSQSHLRAVAG